MVAYKYRLPVGVIGSVTRALQSTIEMEAIDVSNPPGAFGIAVTRDGTSKRARAPGTSAVSADFIGLVTKPFPIQETANANYGAATPLSTSTPDVPPTKGTLDVIKRGYMNVKCWAGTPAKDGVVYIRVAAGTSGFLTGEVAGSIEAVVDSTAASTPVLTGAHFMGPADAEGLCEIAYNL